MNAPYTENDKITMPLDMPGRGTTLVNRLFRGIYISIIAGAFLFCLYWLFSSDRYVSDATIIIQNPDTMTASGFDLAALMSGGLSLPDQLLLQEHLLTVDMLKKVDAKLDLRSHYSDSSRDIASRMWFKDASMEWFHRHYKGRVEVTFDTINGVLRISTQAYTPEMAHAITSMLVEEGERYMNEISHKLAQTQVLFLSGLVETAQANMRAASDKLVAFQNSKGLVSPKATVESIHAIVEKLETQRTNLQTQIAALPRTLDKNHPNRRALATALAAVEKQISQEKAKLASNKGKALNALMEEERQLEMDLEFKKDLYQSALTGLETGRTNTARALKVVSVIQNPTMPEYPWEPRRIYGILSTLCISLFLLGVAYLLKNVILDHVD